MRSDVPELVWVVVQGRSFPSRNDGWHGSTPVSGRRDDLGATRQDLIYEKDYEGLVELVVVTPSGGKVTTPSSVYLPVGLLTCEFI